MEESLILLKEKFHLKETDANQYSPLVLAYLGDAVYEILIRTIVVSEGNMQVNKLHKKSSALVKAAAQAEFLMRKTSRRRNMPFISGEEMQNPSPWRRTRR